MDVDGDESFKLGSLHFRQVPCGLVNQCVQQLQEELIGLLHDFAVILGILQSLSGISCPNQLNAQQTHLQSTNGVSVYYKISNNDCAKITLKNQGFKDWRCLNDISMCLSTLIWEHLG